MISFACFSPHPPIILPSIGSEKDRAKVKNIIKSLENLEKKLKEAKPDSIIISSPHPDWGFNVPLHFLYPNSPPSSSLRSDYGNTNGHIRIKKYLIGLESPKFYFEKGKKVYQELEKDKKYALIASGDLSHCLKEDGPYGFHPQGPKFDKALIKFLKKKDIENFLKLDEMFPEAGECGLRSFSFLLGILEAHSTNSGQDWQPEILSYEAPFGVGYLVTNFRINENSSRPSKFYVAKFRWAR